MSKESKKDLVAIAKSYTMPKFEAAPITEGEIELVAAYLKGELTTRQVGHALSEAGLSADKYPSSRIVTIVRHMAKEKRIKF